MSEIIERLEKASGPDRELDAEIWLATTPGATRRKRTYTHQATGTPCEIDETRDASHRLIIVPPYTSSIDAALTLYEVIPAMVSADPIRTCIDAFEQREMLRVYPNMRRYCERASLEALKEGPRHAG